LPGYAAATSDDGGKGKDGIRGDILLVKKPYAQPDPGDEQYIEAPIDKYDRPGDILEPISQNDPQDNR
jgi:hypothetical protein